MNSVPLLKRSGTHGADRWEPRDCERLSKEFGVRFGLPIDMSSKMSGLKAISNALNEGNLARAQIATVLLGIPEPPPLKKSARSRNEMIKFIRDLHWSGLIKADWDPDEHPRWPAGAPDSQGGQFAPGTDSDECGRGETNRRRWMRAKGEKWPTDAAGRNYDAHHIKPKADGGTDDPDNIRPMPHDEHVREHMENDDFSRWTREAWARRKKEKEEKEKASEPQPESGERTEDESSDDRPANTIEPEPNPEPPGSEPKTSPKSQTGSNSTAQSHAGFPRSGPTKPKPQDDSDERALEDTITIETLIEDALIGALF